ncbi:MAG: DUF2752 domain-containing protein [Spirochaetes bacterium]|nr:DUF2752 domain-containing protein [Spirochaetota bacterium]
MAVGVPIAMFVIPLDFFEHGRSLCIFKNLFDWDCPGCGLTRAIACIFHGEFQRAFAFNRMVVFIFPLLSYLYIKYFYNRLQDLLGLDRIRHHLV